MPLIGDLLIFILQIFFWIIIAQVVLSWLIAFDVINTRNPQAANIVRLIDRITAPVFTPLRKIIPPIAGIDITPIFVILLIQGLEILIRNVFYS